jgi:hypothetical protein
MVRRTDTSQAEGVVVMADIRSDWLWEFSVDDQPEWVKAAAARYVERMLSAPAAEEVRAMLNV